MARSLSRAKCAACGRETNVSDLQASHLIPFIPGVVDWGLTPDWLDQQDNLVLAHRGKCNNLVELEPAGVVERLDELDIDFKDSPAVKGGFVVVIYDSKSQSYSVEFQNQ